MLFNWSCLSKKLWFNICSAYDRAEVLRCAAGNKQISEKGSTDPIQTSFQSNTVSPTHLLQRITIGVIIFIEPARTNRWTLFILTANEEQIANIKALLLLPLIGLKWQVLTFLTQACEAELQQLSHIIRSSFFRPWGLPLHVRLGLLLAPEHQRLLLQGSSSSSAPSSWSGGCHNDYDYDHYNYVVRIILMIMMIL